MKLKWLYLPVIILLLFESCMDLKHTEIEDVDVIRVLGIDIVGDQYILSALYNVNGGADEAVSGVNVLEAKGKTMYQAYENLKIKNKKSITLAHTSYFLVGEMAARNGIDICMDFITRDVTTKSDAYILIAKGNRANHLLKDSMKKGGFIQDDLTTMIQKQMEKHKKNRNTISVYLNELENPDTSILIPYLNQEGEFLYIEGYAVFKGKKLYDYLDADTSTGIDFFQNNIRLYPISLDDKVGLLISNCKIKLNSNIKNGNIVVNASTYFDSNLREIIKNETIFNFNEIEKLTNKQNEYMNELLQKPIDFSKRTHLDVIGIAKLIERQHYKEWRTIQSEWNNKIGTIDYNLNFESKTARNYVLRSLE